MPKFQTASNEKQNHFSGNKKNYKMKRKTNTITLIKNFSFAYYIPSVYCSLARLCLETALKKCKYIFKNFPDLKFNDIYLGLQLDCFSFCQKPIKCHLQFCEAHLIQSLHSAKSGLLTAAFELNFWRDYNSLEEKKKTGLT